VHTTPKTPFDRRYSGSINRTGKPSITAYHLEQKLIKSIGIYAFLPPYVYIKPGNGVKEGRTLVRVMVPTLTVATAVDRTVVVGSGSLIDIQQNFFDPPRSMLTCWRHV